LSARAFDHPVRRRSV